MWLSSRLTRTLPLAVALSGLLSACGFAPVYAPGSDGLALRGAIQVETPDTRADLELAQQIAARLAPPQNPDYRLEVDQRVTVETVAISGTREITRYNLFGVADWALVDIATDQIVDEGRVDSFTSYNATGTTLATTAAEDDARNRLSVALANLIVSRLVVRPPEQS